MGYEKHVKYKNWDLSDEEKFLMITNKVNSLNIADVLQHHGVTIEKQTGSRLMALCPFHMDNRIGSFSINLKTNACHCFSCNNGGGVITAMQKIFNMDRAQTILKVACDEKIIDRDEYERLSGIEYDESSLTEVKKSFKPREKKRVDNATLSMWTEVYETMRDFFGLRDEHRYTLKNDRCLPNSRIEKDYFSIDTSTSADISRLVYHLKNKLPQYADKLKNIPGFYEENRDGNWRLQTFSFKGIGILIRNANGLIVGIQVRSDEIGEHESRYKFLSYEFSKADKLFRGGASVGSPIDVLMPEKSNGKLCIVEGRFKSEILIQQGLTALSVQGVNNFKGIEKEIADIEAKVGRKYEKAFLFFDADFAKNAQVYRAALSLKAYLYEKRPDIELIIAIWDEVLGKRY